MATKTTTQQVEHKMEPREEHRWLQKLVGEWDVETEAVMEPGKPPHKSTGTERVRAFGDLWIIAEASGQMPDGDTMRNVVTLGYDPEQQRFVGTFISDTMTKLWLYEGELESGKRTLSLYSEGPSLTGDGSTVRYRDSIEFVSDDHRIFRSQMAAEDGSWLEPMMTMHHRRKR